MIEFLSKSLNPWQVIVMTCCNPYEQVHAPRINRSLMRVVWGLSLLLLQTWDVFLPKSRTDLDMVRIITLCKLCCRKYHDIAQTFETLASGKLLGRGQDGKKRCRSFLCDVGLVSIIDLRSLYCHSFYQRIEVCVSWPSWPWCSQDPYNLICPFVFYQFNLGQWKTSAKLILQSWVFDIAIPNRTTRNAQQAFLALSSLAVWTTSIAEAQSNKVTQSDSSLVLMLPLLFWPFA